MKSKIIFIMLLISIFFISTNAFGKNDVAVVNNKLYTEECGACHFVYQPGFLPERSWKKIMSGLSDHFGDNAELAKEDLKEITDYVLKNAADHSNYKRSVKIMRSLAPNEIPLRITEAPYIIRKHHEIPKRLITDNPQVKTLSRCAACHVDAAKGDYSEHGVMIPGKGRWED